MKDTAKWFSYTYVYIYIHIYNLLQILFCLGYYKILSIVPCAIQQSRLITYFIYNSVYMSKVIQTLNWFLLPHLSPLVTISLFSMSVSPFLFYKYVFCIKFFIPHVSTIIWYLSVSVWLISHSTANSTISFFLWLSNISLCMYTYHIFFSTHITYHTFFLQYALQYLFLYINLDNLKYN